MLQDQLNAYRNGTEPDPETLARICAVLQQLAEEAGGEPGHAPVAAARSGPGGRRTALPVVAVVT